MTTTTHRQISSAGGTRRILPGFLARIAGGVRSYFKRSQAEAHLEALDDRLLLDIGVRRSEIHQMVWGGKR